MDELQRRWHFENVLKAYPGRREGGVGDHFPMAEARPAAAALMSEWLGGDRVVFCGRLVAEAFDFDGQCWFEWEAFGRVVAAMIPHPSGLNRSWNDSVNQLAGQVFFSELLRVA